MIDTAVNNGNGANQQQQQQPTIQVFGSKYKHNMRTQKSLETVSQKYNDIVELFLSPQLELVSVLCSMTLVKETAPNTVNISEALVNFFEMHCSLRSSYLLKWAIDREIENTANGATLFRGLSTATRLISAFYKRVGDGYLKYLLQPFVLDLCSRNFSFEIDPDKAGKGVDVQTNLEKLITITQQLLDKILDSADQCPLSIRAILNHTQEKVEKKFPDMKTTVVGGFIFLRYICPAIVAPEVFGLISDNPSTDSRRGLVLVSKLLQNLANEMPFGVGIKEEYMSYLNQFISNNSKRIHWFFDKLASDKIGSGQSYIKDSSRIRSKSESPPLRPLGSSQKIPNIVYLNGANSNGKDAASNGNGKDTTSNGNGKDNGNNNINNVFMYQDNYTEEFMMDNLNILIGQLFEHKERIETVLSNENNQESHELVKRLDSALSSIKQKQLFKVPWGKKNKDSSSNMSSQNLTKPKKSGSSASLNPYITGSNANMSKSVPELKFDATEEEIQSHLFNSVTTVQAFYRHKLELKELELKSHIDEINILKRELEEIKTRSSVIKKLREELEVEKKKRKDSEACLKRCVDKLRSLGHDIGETVAFSDESCLSSSDLTSLIEETLELSKKKKSSSSLSLSKKSESSTNIQGLAAPTSHSTPHTPHKQPLHHSSNNSSLPPPQSLSESNDPPVIDLAEIRRSVTSGSIAETMLSSSTTGEIDSGNNNGAGNGIHTKRGHSRNNSNSDYLASELTSSESVNGYDLEAEDRIIQACVDGDVEDDEGIDLLEFLKEVGEARTQQEKDLSKEEDPKKKRGSILFKHLPSLKLTSSKKKKGGSFNGTTGGGISSSPSPTSSSSSTSSKSSNNNKEMGSLATLEV
eukprot:gene3297-4129_t